MTRTRTTNLDPEVRLLAALADPTRLAIVRQLVECAETCACDFTSCCDVGQPTVSHHLRVLREAGVVTSERRGQSIYYSLAPDTAQRLGAVAGSLVPGVNAGHLVALSSVQRGLHGGPGSPGRLIRSLPSGRA